MALKTPEPIVTEQINTWTIRAMELIMPELPELPRMVVTLASGYDDGEHGIAWLREQRIEVPSEDVVSSWLAVVSDVSIYAAVKASLYAWLIDHSYIPEDATEQ